MSDGMQLTFVKTKLETILRLAIEPLAQASREAADCYFYGRN